MKWHVQWKEKNVKCSKLCYRNLMETDRFATNRKILIGL